MGDALQPLAFQLLAADPAPAEFTVDTVAIDRHAGAALIGTFGMAGGQAIDLASQGSSSTSVRWKTCMRAKPER